MAPTARPGNWLKPKSPPKPVNSTAVGVAPSSARSVFGTSNTTLPETVLPLPILWFGFVTESVTDDVASGCVGYCVAPSRRLICASRKATAFPEVFLTWTVTAIHAFVFGSSGPMLPLPILIRAMGATLETSSVNGFRATACARSAATTVTLVDRQAPSRPPGGPKASRSQTGSCVAAAGCLAPTGASFDPPSLLAAPAPSAPNATNASPTRIAANPLVTDTRRTLPVEAHEQPP